MADTNKLAELTKWPTDETEVTVDLILRCVGADTQRMYLKKWAAIEKDSEYMRSPLYMAQTQTLIAAVGLMSCLRMLSKANPAKARDFAVDYWRMCDSGDSFGELLWQFTEDAGLDPNLITLTDGNHAAPTQRRNAVFPWREG